MNAPRLLVLCLAAAWLVAVGCSPPPVTPPGPAVEATASAASADASQPVGALDPATLFNCNCDKPAAPRLDPNNLPVDVSLNNVPSCKVRPGGCQICFDCFGWQMFVALNWRAGRPGSPDPTKPFGAPGDLSPLVWETYAEVDQIFGGQPLVPWESRKIEKRLVKDLRSKLQADHHWLTDRDGNQVLYEIRVNQDLYEYIDRNKLSTKLGLLAAFGANGKGIDLPAGSEGGSTGTIEVKAAWRLVPDNMIEQWKPLYKLSEALVDNKKRTVALIGLHIAKKTPKLHQWAWATFEHELNAPLEGEMPDPAKRYNLWTPGLPENYTPSYKSPPDAHGNPPTPRDKTVQVRRAIDIGETAKKVNQYLQTILPEKSVFRHYRLVNVQWPMEPKAIPTNLTEPPPDGDPRPQVVANITMETYMQQKDSGGGAGVKADTPLTNPEDRGKSSCIGCHRLSSVTPSFAPGSTGTWHTDYSAIFFKAK